LAGWPGAFASWDCKHFEWENCPVRLAGQSKVYSDGGKKTLVLEAIADANLYIWYSFFGECGSLNDLNILDKSSTVGSILSETFNVSVEPYTLNVFTRDWMYFLADVIYPDWSIFVKTIRRAVTTMEEVFKTSQESTRKDIERAFGVLVKCFHYLKRPLLYWYLKDTKSILDCCIIMHNMIVEYRRHAYMAATNGFDIPIPNNDLEQEVEEPINYTSLFGHKNVADGHNKAIAEELADRVSTVLGNVEDIQKYNNLRSNLMIHKTY
jgi:Plant transposon protein